MMVGQLAWLIGEPYWHDGRVAWSTDAGLIVPTPNDFALAQRRLYQLRRYPISADLALGDAKAWSQRATERLQLAKRLHSVQEPDIPGLLQRAKANNHSVVPRLIELLVAEAVCLNQLPASPTTALVTCGSASKEQLQTLLKDETVPLAARALAALALGALNRRRSHSSETADMRSVQPWLRRAYNWGLNFGPSASPGLIATLLGDEDGYGLAERFHRSQQHSNPFTLQESDLRELLAKGVPPVKVVLFAEATQAGTKLVDRIMQRQDDLLDAAKRKRRDVAMDLRQQGQQMLDAMVQLLHNLVRSTHDPEVVAPFFRFVHVMLELSRPTPLITDVISRVLAMDEYLSRELHTTWLLFLIDIQERVWDPTKRPNHKMEYHLVDWFQQIWRLEVQPMAELFQMARDISVVRQVYEFGQHEYLSRFLWQSADLLQFALKLMRDGYMHHRSYGAWQIYNQISQFSNAREARAIVQPILQALMHAQPEHRLHYLNTLMGIVPETRREARRALQQIAPYMHLLLDRQHCDDESCLCSWIMSSVLNIASTVPDQAQQWIEWIVAYERECTQKTSWTWREGETLVLGVWLGVTIAHGSFTRFQAIVRTAVEHPFDQRRELLERGLTLLANYPVFQAALADLVPQQPRRCFTLLERLGLAARLTTDLRQPLLELEEMGDVSSMDAETVHADSILQVDAIVSPGWQSLLEHVPEAAPLAATYLYTQWLIGGEFELPAGVRRALHQPLKLERELAHLQTKLQHEPERDDLRLRVQNVQAYLSDQTTLQNSVREEVLERIRVVRNEALFAAAERQLQACFRIRLIEVAGQIPEGMQLDNNLLNATALTLDIIHNRRLLQKLLRAWLAGDHRWREQHPANAQFLTQLAEQGADISRWLSKYPQSYACPGVAGNRVRLHLETDPLHILQMGNYFDTCLSFGNINAFSTVANACELNKRVIYAVDGSGRIIGRKLIGINTDGQMVGFHTYTVVHGEQGGNALRAIIWKYSTSFAEHCQISQADAGTVPTLFADEWYDDGVVRWDDDEPIRAESDTSQ